jgi:hypothetical protein
MIKAFRDSNIRAVHAYSRGYGPGAKYPNDAERMLKQHFGANDGLVRIASVDVYGGNTTPRMFDVGYGIYKVINDGHATIVNLILAGEDPVATDSLVAHLLGFNPWDLDFLHMAAKREMGHHGLDKLEINGADPDPLRRHWAKPKAWFGRANRLWRVTSNPASPRETWRQIESPTDTLHFDAKTSRTFAAATQIESKGHAKGFLWIGATGKFQAELNGQLVMAEEGRTRYRNGQFQQAVALKPGNNELLIKLQTLEEKAPRLSAYMIGLRNDGDTLDGIRWH